MFLPYSILICVILSDLSLIELVSGQPQPPTWTTATSFSKTSSDCTDITTLEASSNTGDAVLYSVESQTPNAGFATGLNIASDTILTCTAGSISQSTYQVVVRAKYQSDTSVFTDQTITITFTDQTPATGPTWNTGASHSLDKGDSSACNTVVTLSASSTDGSTTVTYSIQGSSVFTIAGSNILSCTIGQITQSSYTVVVRANQDNNVHTDLTLTITVTDSSSGSGSSSESNSGGSNDGWIYGTVFGSLGGAAAIIGGTVFVFKVLSKSSGGISSTDSRAGKPKEETVETSPITTEKANKVLPNGDATV